MVTTFDSVCLEHLIDIKEQLGQVEARLHFVDQLDSRVRNLEFISSRQIGSWKAIAIVGGVASTLGGIMVSAANVLW